MRNRSSRFPTRSDTNRAVTEDGLRLEISDLESRGIDLPSIFQDKSVTSSIPDYFQNSEPPIICYKYKKPIRHTIFKFNKLVSDLDIHANTPSS